jgi:hypothetical protein
VGVPDNVAGDQQGGAVRVPFGSGVEQRAQTIDGHAGPTHP